MRKLESQNHTFQYHCRFRQATIHTPEVQLLTFLRQKYVHTEGVHLFVVFKISLGIFFIISYILANYIFEIEMHYLHILGILFLATFSFIYFFSKSKNLDATSKIVIPTTSMESWKNRHLVTFILLVLMVLVFLFFSPLGIA